MEKLELRFNDGRTMQVSKGKSLFEITKSIYSECDFQILAAKVNNQLCSLDCVLEKDSTIEFLTYNSKLGQEVYRRTANFILYIAVNELFYNTRLVIGHSLGNGFYFDFFLDIPVNHEVLNLIKSKMQEIIKEDTLFGKKVLGREEAIHYFRERAMADKVRLLGTLELGEIAIYENRNFSDLAFFPLAHSTGCISKFDLKTYSPGFVMQFPEQKNFSLNADIGKNAKLFNIYHESKKWGMILGVNNVGRLNQLIRNNGVSNLIKVAESLHEKKIAKIADSIDRQRGNIKLILIAGPSAAGKTTFSKRLGIHLMVNGFRPISISVDDYFVNRELCPKDENGEYDFEALEALDVELFNQHVSALLNGKEVAIPKFDFETGRRIENQRVLLLEDDQLLIVEGLHCLNDKLSASIPKENKCKIYISPLTQLTIDDHNRISTTDTRILRRMVRDQYFRNYKPFETLERFDSVIRGERKNIFPFQESADFVFNSALAYELAILKDYATPLLYSISEKERTYSEARRLLNFLELFCSVSSEEIPPTSILREYIGGSSFQY